MSRATINGFRQLVYAYVLHWMNMSIFAVVFFVFFFSVSILVHFIIFDVLKHRFVIVVAKRAEQIERKGERVNLRL